MTAPSGDGSQPPIIVQVVIDTRQLEQQAGQAGQRAGEEAGGGFQKAFKKAGVAAGLALAGGIVASANIQDANIKLQKQLGLNAEEAGRIGKVSGELYAKGYGESIDDVNDALKTVVSQFDGLRDASQQDIQSVTKDVLNLSKTFDVDFNETVRAANNLVRNGLAPDAQSALDILTKGFQSGVDKGGDLLDTFNEYSVQFKKMGIDGQTALGLLNQGLQGGAINADKVADAIKEFSLRASTGLKGAANFSQPVATAFQQIGLNADEMSRAIANGGPGAEQALQTTLTKLKQVKDPAVQAAAAAALFGTQAEDLGASLYSLNVDTAVSGLGEVKGAVGALDVKSPMQQFEAFKRQVISFAAEIGSSVIPVLTRVADILQAVLGPVLDWIAGVLKNNKDVVAALVIGLGSLWAAYKGYKAIQAVNTFLNSYNVFLARQGILLTANAIKTQVIAAATRAWTVVQAAFNVVMNANPLVLITTLIIALVAAIVVAYTKSETFRQIVQAVWTAIKNVVGSVVQFLIDVISKAWDFIKTVTSVVWEGIKIYFTVWWKVISTVFSTAVAVIEAVVQGVWTAIKTVTMLIWDGIKLYFTVWWTVLKTIFTTAINVITSAVSAAWNGLKTLVTTIFNGIKTTIQTIWNSITSFVSSGVKAVVDTITSIPSKIAGLAASMLKAGEDFIGNLWKGITGAFSTITGGIGDFVSSIANGIKNALNNLLNLPWVVSFPKVHVPGTNVDIGGNSVTILPRFAQGGWVNGPGTGLSDSMMAMLSNGEFVVSAAKANANRPAMEAIDRGEPVIPAAWAGAGGGREVTVNNNYFGPTTSAGRRRETEWNLRFAAV